MAESSMIRVIKKADADDAGQTTTICARVRFVCFISVNLLILTAENQREKKNRLGVEKYGTGMF